jgi:hypothetical protein
MISRDPAVAEEKSTAAGPNNALSVRNAVNGTSIASPVKINRRKK